jgi:hypothetical protein
MNFLDAILDYEKDRGIKRDNPDLYFEDLFPSISKAAAEIGSPAVLRLKRQNEKKSQQDEKAARKLADTSIPAFLLLITKLRKKYVKSEISDRDLVKLLIADKDVLEFLETYIGPDISSRHKTVIYKIRDAAQSKDETKVYAKDIARLILVSYYKDAELYRHREVLRNQIPEFLGFLPPNLVVDLDPNGYIASLTERFANIGETVDVKHQRIVELLNGMEGIRKEVRSSLRGTFGSVDQMCAVAVSIMLNTGIRPSNEGNGVFWDPVKNVPLRSKAQQDASPDKIWLKTYGATDIETSHVKFSGSTVSLEFHGKMGGVNKAHFSDPTLVKVFKQYYDKAVKEGESRVLRSGRGEPLRVDQVRAYCAQFGFTPRTLRRLKATEELYSNLLIEQEVLYAEIRKIAKSKRIRETIADAVYRATSRAIAKSQEALSHEDSDVTVENYIDPTILLLFLSKGRLDTSITNTIMAGDLVLDFSPAKFIKAAMGIS